MDCCFGFLVDIFEAFNVVNKLLQGNDKNVIICKDKMTVFSLKLDLWITKINDSYYAAFPTINSFLDEKEIAPEENLLDAMKVHLLMLKNELSHYFPEQQRESEWSAVIKNHYILKLENLPTEDTSIQEDFLIK